MTGATILVVAELAIEEAAHHIAVKVLEQEMNAGRYPGSTSWNNLYKRNPGVIRRCIPHIDRFIAAVKAIPIAIVAASTMVETAPVLSDLMVKNMKRYELLAADGYHLAVAEALGISSVATLDRDWLRASNDFTILTNR